MTAGSSSDCRPVGLTGRFSDETRWQHQVVLADSAQVRARANPVRVSVDGAQPPSATSTRAGLCAAGANLPGCRRVLELLGNADSAPDWSELYKAHGILIDNVPGFCQRGWVTKDQISTFTASANRREVSGDLARHARLKGDPPRRTMTMGEARQLIGALVTRWLDWLRESSNS